MWDFLESLHKLFRRKMKENIQLTVTYIFNPIWNNSSEGVPNSVFLNHGSISMLL